MAEQTPKPIDDFGRKIGGAAKDIRAAKKIAELLALYGSWEEIEKQKYIQRDELFKMPNFARLIDNGLDRDVAYLVRKLRSVMPKIPYEQNDRFRTAYIMQISYYKDMLECKTFDEALELLKKVDEMYAELGKKPVFRVGYDELQSRLRAEMFSDSKGAVYRDFHVTPEERIRAFYMFAHGSETSEIADSGWRADVRRLVMRLSAEDAALNGTRNNYSFYISANLLTDEVQSAINDPNKVILLKVGASHFQPQVFDSLEEAYRAAEELESDRIQRMYEEDGKEQSHRKNEKLTLAPRQLAAIRRTGDDVLAGRNATEDDYLQALGMSGGEFGNAEDQKLRQANMNYGYEAMVDLANALGIQTKDVSLSLDEAEGGAQGRPCLALAFGSRGRGKALAHYEPIRNVINLTKEKGAGSLAHEWGHAFDNFLAHFFGEADGMMYFATERAMYGRSTVQSDCRDLLAGLIATMRYKEGSPRTETDFYINARKLDKCYSKAGTQTSEGLKKNGQYWSSVTEMFARAFACYVEDKLKELNCSNDFLCGHASKMEGKDSHGNTILTYPTGEERKRINSAFDALFEELRERGIFHGEAQIKNSVQKLPTKFTVMPEHGDEAILSGLSVKPPKESAYWGKKPKAVRKINSGIFELEGKKGETAIVMTDEIARAILTPECYDIGETAEEDGVKFRMFNGETKSAFVLQELIDKEAFFDIRDYHAVYYNQSWSEVKQRTFQALQKRMESVMQHENDPEYASQIQLLNARREVIEKAQTMQTEPEALAFDEEAEKRRIEEESARMAAAEAAANRMAAVRGYNIGDVIRFVEPTTGELILGEIMDKTEDQFSIHGYQDETLSGLFTYSGLLTMESIAEHDTELVGRADAMRAKAGTKGVSGEELQEVLKKSQIAQNDPEMERIFRVESAQGVNQSWKLQEKVLPKTEAVVFEVVPVNPDANNKYILRAAESFGVKLIEGSNIVQTAYSMAVLQAEKNAEEFGISAGEVLEIHAHNIRTKDGRTISRPAEIALITGIDYQTSVVSYKIYGDETLSGDAIRTDSKPLGMLKKIGFESLGEAATIRERIVNEQHPQPQKETNEAQEGDEMKSAFQAQLYKGYPELQSLIDEHKPFGVLVLSTSGLDKADEPFRFFISKCEYDEASGKYQRTATSDIVCAISQERFAQALRTIQEGGFDVFKSSGLNFKEYFAALYKDKYPSAKQAETETAQWLHEHLDGIPIVANNAEFIRQALRTVGANQFFDGLTDSGLVIDQILVGEEFARKAGLTKRTLNAISEFVSGKPVEDGIEHRADAIVEMADVMGKGVEKVKAEQEAAQKPETQKAPEPAPQTPASPKAPEPPAQKGFRFGSGKAKTGEQKRQEIAEEAEKEKLREEGRQKYAKGGFDYKYDLLAQKGQVAPREQLFDPQCDCDMNRLLSILKQKGGNKGVTVIGVATTGIEYGKGGVVMDYGAPIHVSIHPLYIDNGSFKKKSSDAPLEFDVKFTDAAGQEKLEKAYAAAKNGGFDAFAYAGIDMEEYQSGVSKNGKLVLTNADAGALIRQYFDSHPTDEFPVITFDADLTRSAISAFRRNIVPQVNIVSAIQEFMSASSVNPSIPQTLIRLPERPDGMNDSEYQQYIKQQHRVVMDSWQNLRFDTMMADTAVKPASNSTDAKTISVVKACAFISQIMKRREMTMQSLDEESKKELDATIQALVQNIRAEKENASPAPAPKPAPQPAPKSEPKPEPAPQPEAKEQPKAEPEPEPEKPEETKAPADGIQLGDSAKPVFKFGGGGQSPKVDQSKLRRDPAQENEKPEAPEEPEESSTVFTGSELQGIAEHDEQQQTQLDLQEGMYAPTDDIPAETVDENYDFYDDEPEEAPKQETVTAAPQKPEEKADPISEPAAEQKPEEPEQPASKGTETGGIDLAQMMAAAVQNAMQEPEQPQGDSLSADELRTTRQGGGKIDVVAPIKPVDVIKVGEVNIPEQDGKAAEPAQISEPAPASNSLSADVQQLMRMHQETSTQLQAVTAVLNTTVGLFTNIYEAQTQQLAAAEERAARAEENQTLLLNTIQAMATAEQQIPIVLQSVGDSVSHSVESVGSGVKDVGAGVKEISATNQSISNSVNGQLQAQQAIAQTIAALTQVCTTTLQQLDTFTKTAAVQQETANLALDGMVAAVAEIYNGELNANTSVALTDIKAKLQHLVGDNPRMQEIAPLLDEMITEARENSKGKELPPV